MGSGGARARSGSAPDPNALRRDRKDDAAWSTLPASGRQGDLPAWPLPEQSTREAELWAVYWAKPQAILWERNGQELEVALHVRRLEQVEKPGASISLGTLVRQQMDALLLTLPAMLSARIQIVADGPVAAAKRESAAERVASSSARDRLRVVDSADGA